MNPFRALFWRRRAVDWRYTGSRVFPFAARTDGAWWVVRMNDFPDHPLYTLFVDGRRVADVDDAPPQWRFEIAGPALRPAERAEALASVRGLARYGTESGRPCPGLVDTCDSRDDAAAAAVEGDYPYRADVTPDR